jgi:hypothetical protein
MSVPTKTVKDKEEFCRLEFDYFEVRIAEIEVRIE